MYAPTAQTSSTNAATGDAVTRPVATLAGVGFVAVLGLGEMFARSTRDIGITQAMNRLHHGVVGLVASDIYLGLEPAYAVALTLLVCAAIAVWQRNAFAGLRFGAAVAMTWVPVALLKVIFHRARPSALLLQVPPTVHAHDWSFSSGHTAFVTALVMVGVLATRTVAARAIMSLVAVASIAIIASVVLIDGMHFPSDVLASIIWAATMAPLMWAVSGRACGWAAQRVARG